MVSFIDFIVDKQRETQNEKRIAQVYVEDNPDSQPENPFSHVYPRPVALRTPRTSLYTCSYFSAIPWEEKCFLTIS